MYSPKIREELIPRLYRLARGLNMPMTRVVNALLAHGIARVEEGVENITEPPAGGFRRTQRKKRKAQHSHRARQRNTS